MRDPIKYNPEKGRFLKVQTDREKEWGGMPEFVQKDKTPYKSITVHFECEEDLKKFRALLNQHMTKKTKYIWYPKKDKNALKQYRYVDEK